MNTTAAQASKYTVGQSVEVKRIDFSTPGFPEVWFAGRVVSVTPNGKLFDVAVQLDAEFDKNGHGLICRQVVGPRGGNKVIRSAVTVNAAAAIDSWHRAGLLSA